MIINEKLNFIKGKFLSEDAKEVLWNVFTAKINYHQMKNFSSVERFGKEDETALERISALKKELVSLDRILAAAEAQNKKLIIGSEISISLSDD